MGDELVKILDGNTFVVSDARGDIEASPSDPMGLFSFDTRFLSRGLRGIRWVSEGLVFGDHRPYLVAALTLDRDWIRSLAAWLGVKPDIEVMATDPRVPDHLAHEVERVNQRFARAEQIKRFAILNRDLTQETGELTPTHKAKRAVVYTKFKDVIDALYQ
jgi:long-chain acyl-CoA synthetase